MIEPIINCNLCSGSGVRAVAVPYRTRIPMWPGYSTWFQSCSCPAGLQRATHLRSLGHGGLFLFEGGRR